MTDSKTATERLREMLDARGVNYYRHEDGEPLRELHEGRDDATSWRIGHANVCAVPFDDYTFDLWIDHATPEQAIAATLGAHSKPQSKTGDALSDDSGSLSDGTLVSGTLTAEQVRGAVKRNSTFDYGDIGEYVSRERWQAITDELNATLGSGECENTWDVELTGRLRFQCSECGAVSLEITPNYCPNCGKAVKR